MVFAITMVLSHHPRAVWMDCIRGHQFEDEDEDDGAGCVGWRK